MLAAKAANIVRNIIRNNFFIEKSIFLSGNVRGTNTIDDLCFSKSFYYSKLNTLRAETFAGSFTFCGHFRESFYLWKL